MVVLVINIFLEYVLVSPGRGICFAEDNAILIILPLHLAPTATVKAIVVYGISYEGPGGCVTDKGRNRKCQVFLVGLVPH